MNLNEDDIPKDILIANSVNLRPFYNNFKFETVFGNKSSAYFIYLPLNIVIYNIKDGTIQCICNENNK